MNNKANSQPPQHDINEFANQLLLIDRLYCLYEKQILKKCMLSAFLHVTQECRNILINYLGLRDKNLHKNINESPKWWLCSAKILLHGEGLANKGFEHTYAFFAWFNRVRCPKVMKARKLK